MKKSNKKGFTIIELVIVIAVIAILAAVLIPTFSNVIKKANESTALQEARNEYTETLAEDIADGLVDGLINATGDSILPSGWVVNTEKSGYDITDYEVKEGWKVSYTTAAGWTATPITTD